MMLPFCRHRYVIRCHGDQYIIAAARLIFTETFLLLSLPQNFNNIFIWLFNFRKQVKMLICLAHADSFPIYLTVGLDNFVSSACS